MPNRDEYQDDYIAALAGGGLPLDDAADALGMTLSALCGRMGRTVADTSQERTEELLCQHGR